MTFVGTSPRSLDGLPHQRVDVLGVRVSAITMGTALTQLQDWITSGGREYVCITGVHGVMESQRDPALLEIHNRAGMVTPDGVPMVWAGRFAKAASMDRVYGPDLFLAAAELAAERGWKFFFYGGKDGIPDLLADKLTARFPALQVVGTYSPPFRALTPDEQAEICATINQSGADIVWVGLSTPKQERWMAENRPFLSASVLIGVGAAFDMHAGMLKQAPKWIQASGMEWFYRLCREPRRLWRRYLGNNPRFVAAIVRRPPKLSADVG